MKEPWLTWAAKVNALSLRERMSVFVAVLLVSAYVVFAMAIDPAQKRSDMLRKQIAAQQAEMSAIRAQQQRPGTSIDPDAANRARADTLKGELDALDQTLKAFEKDLVSADRMPALLQDVLSRDPGLQLVAMRTLPVTPLIDKAKAKDTVSNSSESSKTSAATANVYKHGVEITVRGSYANLHAYLARLERSPWRMFWWRAKLEAHDNGKLTMVVTIYTLSLDKAWLQV